VNGSRVALLDAPDLPEDFRERALDADPEVSKYVVPVKWVKAIPDEEAISRPALFASAVSACKRRDTGTIEVLEEELGIPEPNAELRKTNGVPNGIRTRVASLKGWCPDLTRRWGRGGAAFCLRRLAGRGAGLGRSRGITDAGTTKPQRRTLPDPARSGNLDGLAGRFHPPRIILLEAADLPFGRSQDRVDRAATPGPARSPAEQELGRFEKDRLCPPGAGQFPLSPTGRFSIDASRRSARSWRSWTAMRVSRVRVSEP
jgi:hypothetical protein